MNWLSNCPECKSEGSVELVRGTRKDGTTKCNVCGRIAPILKVPVFKGSNLLKGIK